MFVNVFKTKRSIPTHTPSHIYRSWYSLFINKYIELILSLGIPYPPPVLSINIIILNIISGLDHEDEKGLGGSNFFHDKYLLYPPPFFLSEMCHKSQIVNVYCIYIGRRYYPIYPAFMTGGGGLKFYFLIKNGKFAKVQIFIAKSRYQAKNSNVQKHLQYF